MWDITVNYWAVLVAGLAGMVIGALWYSPVLFGNIWVRMSGFTKEKMDAAKKKGMTKAYVLAMLGNLVMAYVLAHFVGALKITTFVDALQLGFWAWLGFIATTTLSSVLWEGKSWGLWLLNNAHNFVVVVVMAWILSAM